MQDTETGERLVTVREAAEYTGLTTESFRNVLYKQHKAMFHPIREPGKRDTLIKFSEVEEYRRKIQTKRVADRKTTLTPEPATSTLQSSPLQQGIVALIQEIAREQSRIVREGYIDMVAGSATVNIPLMQTVLGSTGGLQDPKTLRLSWQK